MVAYGSAARREADACLRSVARSNPGLSVALVSDKPLGEWPHLVQPRQDPGARLVKLALDTLSPWEATCYLDADTRAHGSLLPGFRALEDGWELVIVPSQRQGGDALGNCPEPDREATWKALGCREVLALQAGVYWWRKCEATARLFAAWRAEFGRHGGMDQGALLRALYASPARVCLFGRPFNGGKTDAVEHRFGAARRAA